MKQKTKSLAPGAILAKKNCSAARNQTVGENNIVVSGHKGRQPINFVRKMTNLCLTLQVHLLADNELVAD